MKKTMILAFAAVAMAAGLATTASAAPLKPMVAGVERADVHQVHYGHGRRHVHQHNRWDNRWNWRKRFWAKRHHHHHHHHNNWSRYDRHDRRWR